jgi:hypothetical protein
MFVYSTTSIQFSVNMVKSLYQYQFLLLFYSLFYDINKQPQLIGQNVRYFRNMG